MKRILAVLLAIGLSGFGATAQAVTNLDITVESVECGSSAITVGPGCTVNYRVMGALDSDVNEGLALAGFDLEFDGGDLTPADEPTDPGTMGNFTKPDGLTNPDGYGGTVARPDGFVYYVLLQVGGSQNTIMNGQVPCPNGDSDCPGTSTCQGTGFCSPVANFPTGTVITGLGKPGSGTPEVVLVTGALTAPTADGAYTLAVTNPFANVIQSGQDGNPFWATEEANSDPANPPVITPLSITVQAGAPCAAPDVTVVKWESVKVHRYILSEDPPDYVEVPLEAVDNSFVEPRGGGIEKVVATFSGAVNRIIAENPANISVTGCASGVPVDLSGTVATPTLLADDMTLEIVISPALPDQATYTFELAGQQSACGAAISQGTVREMIGLVGDVDGTGVVGALDLSDIRNASNTDYGMGDGVVMLGSSDSIRADVDTTGVVGALDLSDGRAADGHYALPVSCP